jgi:hypothetical protein
VGRDGMSRVGDVVWCDLGASILLCLVDYCFDNEHALGWIEKKTLKIFWFALHFVFGPFFWFFGLSFGCFLFREF